MRNPLDMRLTDFSPAWRAILEYLLKHDLPASGSQIDHEVFYGIADEFAIATTISLLLEHGYIEITNKEGNYRNRTYIILPEGQKALRT